MGLAGIRTLVALAWVAAGFLYELGMTLDWEEVRLLALPNWHRRYTSNWTGCSITCSQAMKAWCAYRPNGYGGTTVCAYAMECQSRHGMPIAAWNANRGMECRAEAKVQTSWLEPPTGNEGSTGRDQLLGRVGGLTICR